MLAQFLFIGSASTTSFVSTCCCCTCCTSMSGDSPVTVMVSSSAPTDNCASMFAVNCAVSTMPSRTTVEKPGRLKVIV